MGLVVPLGKEGTLWPWLLLLSLGEDELPGPAGGRWARRVPVDNVGTANGTAVLCKSVISYSRHFHPSPRKNNDS